MNQSTSNAIKAEWVMAKYGGLQAKEVLALADAGVGYFVMERPESGGGGWITVAFRRPKDSPCPEGIAPVMNQQLITKLDDMYKRRHGIIDREVNVVSQKKLHDLRQTLLTSQQKATRIYRSSDPDTWDK